MIDPKDAKIGMPVLFQYPHAHVPEYGVITNIGMIYSYRPQDTLIHVKFVGDQHSKTCYPADLYWPPNMRA